ncbi:hypothetical protein YKV135c [Yokapox virus]|uniref:Uncharacterized protein n=1 Tax=Yokapox virus TaxID=1076255 RepID=G3EI27_9POXV|nr:hypothetical protein YKV135c [Yokapox virus]AEN03724.1 hypothetical protein YKV135c [Yokapox virus]
MSNIYVLRDLCKVVLYIYVLQVKCILLDKLIKYYYYNECVDDEL